MKSHSVATADFIILQLAITILMLTYIVYPLPKRAYVLRDYLGLAAEFLNAFDVMDMVSDIAYIRHCDIGWIVVFYASLGTSVILFSFPIHIEEDDFVLNTNFKSWSSHILDTILGRQSRHGSPKANTFPRNKEKSRCSTSASCRTSSSIGNKETALVTKPDLNIADRRKQGEITDQRATQVCLSMAVGSTVTDEYCVNLQTGNTEKEYEIVVADVWMKVVKTILTVLFTDIMFAAIRLKIMLLENSVELGFNMVVKNIILAVLHLVYLIKHIRALKLHSTCC